MDKEMMPVHPDSRKIKDCPKEVPMYMLNEQWANANHGQTLKRLKERGGLSVREMLAIMDNQPYGRYRNHSDVTVIGILNQRLQATEGKQEGGGEDLWAGYSSNQAYRNGE